MFLYATVSQPSVHHIGEVIIQDNLIDQKQANFWKKSNNCLTIKKPKKMKEFDWSVSAKKHKKSFENWKVSEKEDSLIEKSFVAVFSNCCNHNSLGIHPTILANNKIQPKFYTSIFLLLNMPICNIRLENRSESAHAGVAWMCRRLN